MSNRPLRRPASRPELRGKKWPGAGRRAKASKPAKRTLGRFESLESRQVLAAPSLVPIASQTLFAGAPLHIPLDGFDLDGDNLSFTVTSTNPALTTFIPQGNRSLRLSVENTDPADPFTGDMVFELFEGRAPAATARVIQLAQEGFYDGLIFHRVIDNFVIQAGGFDTNFNFQTRDPFDDQFHPDQQHTSEGLLSFAKTSQDDSNTTQFFVTDVPTRFLDFNHMVFGRLVEGEDIRQKVQTVPTNLNDPVNPSDPPKDSPINNVIIRSATIFQDNEDGVLTINAPEGFSGTSMVTVTASDGNGGTAVQTFEVTIQPDTVNNRPYLEPFNDVIQTTPGTPVSFQLSAVDVEGDPVRFLGQTIDDGLQVNVDPDTGVVTVTPMDGVVGSRDFIVGSVAQDAPANDSLKFDTQRATLNVVFDPATAVELVAGGVSTPDGLKTALNNAPGSTLQFRVRDVLQGATVTIFGDGQQIGQAVVPAPAAGVAPTLVDFVVETDGTVTSTDGLHQITAVQTLAGVSSDPSPALAVTFDTTPPAFTSTPVISVTGGETYTYDAQTDEEGDFGLVYELVQSPTGMTINPQTGMVTWEPQASDAGNVGVVVRATDVVGNLAQQSFELTVNAVPVLDTISVQTVDEQTTLQLTATASDANGAGDALTFFLENAPAGAAIDAASGVFTWTPAEADGPGTFNITVGVRDSFGAEDRQTLEVTVGEVNRPPVLPQISDLRVNRGETTVINAAASDPDLPAQTLTYRLISGPSGASIDQDGLFSFMADGTVGAGPLAVTIEVEDPGGLTDHQSFAIRVNTAPVLTTIADQQVDEQTELTLTVTATDGNLPDDALMFRLENSPAGAMIDPTSGAFSWTPDEADGPGVFDVTVVVEDSTGLEDRQTFKVTVGEVNRPPGLEAITDQQTIVGQLLEVQLTASDADLPAQGLTFSLVNGPAGSSIDATSGLFQWTPDSSVSAGPFSVTVEVRDPGGLTDQATFNITLSTAPIIGPIADQTVDEHATLSLAVPATDANGPADVLTYSLTSGPTGAAIDAGTGLLTWTPSEAQGPGTFDFAVRVVDSTGLEDTATFQVAVAEVNQTPQIQALPDRILDIGETLTFDVTATDADQPAQALTFRLVEGPSGAAIDTGGQFSFTADNTVGAGPLTVTIEVKDSLGLTDQASFTIGVRTPPVLAAIADQQVDEQAPLTLALSATDANLPSDSLTFRLENAPAGASVDAQTGLFTWTPSEAQGPGVFNITAVVEDSTGLEDRQTFQITVAEVNQTPRFAGVADQVVDLGQMLEIDLFATDADLPQQALAFSLVSGPAGAAVDAQSGRFEFTPDDPASGSEAVTARVEDAAGLFDEVTFQVRVNRPPAIADIDDQVIDEGQTLQLPVTATDQDAGDTLTFSLSAGPVGAAAIDPATGVILWAPSETDGPGTFAFTVMAEDSRGLRDTQSFNVTVREINTDPVVVQVPDQQITAGEALTLRIAATDADRPAQALAFELIEGPAEATLDPNSGRFSFTPPADAAAETFDVAIRVSDPAGGEATMTFRLSVVEPSSTTPVPVPIPATLGFLPAFNTPGSRPVAPRQNSPAAPLSGSTSNRLNFFPSLTVSNLGLNPSSVALNSPGAAVAGETTHGGAANFRQGPDTGVASMAPPPSGKKSSATDKPQVRGQDDTGDNDSPDSSDKRPNGHRRVGHRQDDSTPRHGKHTDNDHQGGQSSPQTGGQVPEDAHQKATDEAVSALQLDASSLIIDRLIRGESSPANTAFGPSSQRTSDAQRNTPSTAPLALPVRPATETQRNSAQDVRHVDSAEHVADHGTSSLPLAWAPLGFLAWLQASRSMQEETSSRAGVPRRPKQRPRGKSS